MDKGFAALISPDLGALIAGRAEQLIGAPFRFQGRDPVHGLDCVGVAKLALAAVAGPHLPDFRYRLRGPGRMTCLKWAEQVGLRCLHCDAPSQCGDIICVAPGPGQHHLLVATRGAVVHAHYRIGNVVRWPDCNGWPKLAHWRLGCDAVNADSIL